MRNREKRWRRSVTCFFFFFRSLCTYPDKLLRDFPRSRPWAFPIYRKSRSFEVGTNINRETTTTTNSRAKIKRSRIPSRRHTIETGRTTDAITSASDPAPAASTENTADSIVRFSTRLGRAARFFSLWNPFRFSRSDTRQWRVCPLFLLYGACTRDIKFS